MIDGGTLRQSDSAEGGTDDSEGSIQSVFTSHQPFRPSDHSGKAGERPTRPPSVARSGLHHPASRVGPLRSAVDCETNTIDGGTLRRSDSADGGTDDSEGSIQSVFTSHSGKAGKRQTRPPAVSRASDGTNKISKYFTKTTTTRSTTSPSQVPDTRGC